MKVITLGNIDAFIVKDQLNWFLNEGNLTTDEEIKYEK